MPVFTIQSPDGRKIKIEAADQATALRGAKEWAAANPVAAEPGMASGPEFDAALAAMQNVPGRLKGPEPMKPDLMGATAATLSGIVNSIPVLGPLSQGIVDNIGGHISQAMGGEFDAPVKRREAINAANPIANVAGNLGGAIGSFGALGATKLGAEAMGVGAGKYLPNLLKAGASNQALYTADQYARGESGLDTLGFGLPALLGMGGKVAGDAVSAAGSKIADTITKGLQSRATSAAIKGAPGADDLAAASRRLFQAVDDSGVTVDSQKFGMSVADLIKRATKDRMNPTLDPKATAALKELALAADDALKGGTLTLSDLHTLRQIAQKAAISTEGRDAMFAQRIIEMIDDFAVTPGSMTTPGGQASGQMLKDAISTWGRAKRAGLIEEAIYKAGNQASGLENGLRVQFRAILQDRKKRGLFTPAELQAIEAVANGTSLANVARLLGKFGFGGGSASNMLGGTIGFGAGSVFGGPVAGILAAAAGTGARKASEVMTRKGAERAAQVVATPGIPTVTPLPNFLEPARKPIDILVRGSTYPALPGH